MTDPQDLLRLADEVAANSGSDNLDGRIAMAMGWQPPMLPGICGPNYSGRSRFEWHDQTGQTRGFHPPRYTASLDAAMTLVPEGWGWFVSQPNEKAIASGLLKRDTPVMGEVQYGCDHRYPVAAATPALALCAAALKARAHSTKESDNVR